MPTEAYVRTLLARPELALVPESCAAEIALHEGLVAAPLAPVQPAQLAAVQDDDARENYTVFLRFRDGLLAAGTLEAYYLRLMRSGAVDVPAVFIDAVVQALLRNVLDTSNDALEARAAEMLFRPQRITLQEGQMLAGDRDALDLLHETAGLGEVGRLLRQGGVLQPTAQVQVLTPDNAATYWAESERHHFLLDLTHELTQDLSHGLTLKLTREQQTFETLISGVGQVHLEVVGEKIKRKFGVEMELRPPRVPYRETLKGKVTVQFNVEEKTGRIVDVKADAAKTDAPQALVDCVASAISGLVLNPPDQRKGIAAFEYKFEQKQAK